MNILLKDFIFKPRFREIQKLRTVSISNQTKSPPLLLDPTYKIALITGGTGEVGVTIAHELLKQDVKKVVLFDLNRDQGLQTLNEITCVHGTDKVLFSACDVSQRKCVKECLKNITQEIGNIDIIVNAAGVWNDVDWENEIQSNLFGVISTSILASGYMNPNGVIVNISGVKGLQTLPHSPMLSASFSGIITATRCFGHKDNFSKSKIRVVCLCLGITKTKFIIEAEKRQPTREMAKNLQNYLKRGPTQTVDPLRVAIMRMIRYAESGTIWVCDDAKLYSLNFPSWKCFASMEARFM